MKSLRTTIILLFLLIIVIGVDTYNLESIKRDLQEQIDELPEIDAPSCRTAARALEANWSALLPRLRLSVPKPTLEDFGDRIARLCAAAESGDAIGYREARELLVADPE